MLRISKNPFDPESQDVMLMKNSPVIAVKNYKSKGITNDSVYKVKSIKPLVLTNTRREQEITIDEDIFREAFYINYCSTIHKSSRNYH